jgi:hypothetical protein
MLRATVSYSHSRPLHNLGLQQIHTPIVTFISIVIDQIEYPGKIDTHTRQVEGGCSCEGGPLSFSSD